jgi:hypothetical protein
MEKEYKIKWEDKIYVGTAKKIFEHLVAGSWFGTIESLKKRVWDYYEVDIDSNDPEVVLNKLIELGEVEEIK